MNINFSLEDAVIKRYSVRNYSEQEIEKDKRKAIISFIDSLDNPFGKQVKYHYLDNNDIKSTGKLGTYGVIKGGKNYIGASIKFEDLALEAVGYELEVLILYLAHLGLGTCWLGGTFNRKGFAEAMDIGENELFPIVTPYGYPAAKKHGKEIVMRKMIQADSRKEWKELFYINDFQSPLTMEEAGDLGFPLEMVRLGPSASNKQPWRIVIKDKICHFYEHKEPGYSKAFPYDIQRIDMGIAAAHFDLAVKEKGIKGDFKISSQPDIEVAENMEYIYSWVRQ